MFILKNFYSEKNESKKQKEVQDIYECFGYENVNYRIQYGDYLQAFLGYARVTLNK